MSNSNVSVQDLLKGAKNDGVISAKSVSILNVPDIGHEIQSALGIPVDDFQASEVVIVSILVDDSSSIRFAKNTQNVSDGHNLVLKSLRDCKQNSNILIHTRYLNGKILYAYTTLPNAEEMDSSNYNPSGGTPLYDQTAIMLGTVLAKTQEFAQSGVPVRSVTIIISDGADCGSARSTANNVNVLVTEMLKTENHIIIAMGINDGMTDYHQVYNEMGIDNDWILTPGNNPSEIRKAFALVSQSAVRASQSAVNFSQVANSGLGKP